MAYWMSLVELLEWEVVSRRAKLNRVRDEALVLIEEHRGFEKLSEALIHERSIPFLPVCIIKAY